MPHSDTMQIAPGDWIATEGRAKWYEPHLRALYAGIREHSKRRYPKRFPDDAPTWGMTHVRIALGPSRSSSRSFDFFEMTFPSGRIAPAASANLDSKFRAGLLRVIRFPNATIDPVALRGAAVKWDRVAYDLGDLPDIAISGLFGLTNVVIPIFGDRLKRMGVCSTVAARILQNASDIRFPIACEAMDPNAPFNYYGVDPQLVADKPCEPIDITAYLHASALA